MAAPGSQTDGTIDALLQQRAQYEQWLARLASTADKAPASVRDRVRGDYEARLTQVIDELRGHAATIAAELEQHRSTRGRLEDERRKAEEALAEAEVRHAVGEYGDDEWQRLRDRSERHLDGVRTELQAVGAEIDRLAEVQALIEAPAPAAGHESTAFSTPAPAIPAEDAEPVLPLTMLTEPELTSPAAVSEEPAEHVLDEPPPSSSSPSPMDELAFLKSVSDEDREPSPSPRQVSTAPAPKLAEPEAPAPAGSGAAKAAGVAKTLKCNECGTFNRATEWYCERCGAELAAL